MEEIVISLSIAGIVACVAGVWRLSMQYAALQAEVRFLNARLTKLEAHDDVPRLAGQSLINGEARN